MGCKSWGFNPRTRVGCDTAHLLTVDETSVSIHAPVWGATINKPWYSLRGTFQSTHPCGVRHDIDTTVSGDVVSIHAPVWGATKWYQLEYLI